MMSFMKLRQAAAIIRSGGVIAYPTESVFGLGCDPMAAEAVERILDIKGRDPRAGLILVAADLGQLRNWIEPSSAERARITQPMGHPVTWVVTAAAGVPAWITGDRSTIAVRVTPHPDTAAICRVSQTPLVSTSANLSGHRPARHSLVLRRLFGEHVDLIVPGEPWTSDRPTRILDATTGIVLR